MSEGWPPQMSEGEELLWFAVGAIVVIGIVVTLGVVLL